ncbi:hypothetical protein F2P47_06650 [Parvibaculum sedimenti]|uniref:Helix-turn-helix domain-containing protein n=1 Tax=Parvibaculum sedimenti TaxID=2608632 RepID=A0A6N6VJL4_9HYPH|nr:helix-turn-helix domain-containing protein [Parvibaculum sedimenti]KAB7740720.1 hypothetical protein F2P47_06650 [Parvibaculum sedimenti]
MAKRKDDDLPRGALPAVVADVYEAVDAALKDHDAAKDSGFKKVFKAGWQRIQKLADRSPKALKLWGFLGEHAGPNGAVLIGQADLAEAVGCSTRTIRSLVRLLEDEGAIITIREAGGCIYALNPNEVWAMAADQRQWAPFKTNAVFSKGARGLLTKRLSVSKFQSGPGRWTPSRGRKDGAGGQ